MEETGCPTSSLPLTVRPCTACLRGILAWPRCWSSCARQVVAAQVRAQLGAERYARTGERHGYRNRVRPRKLTTRGGQLTLRVPPVREGACSPELRARAQRSEPALVLARLERVVPGVSTRQVSASTEEWCGTSCATSTGSARCARLDPLVTAWNERSLAEQAFPCVLVDALVRQVRAGLARARAVGLGCHRGQGDGLPGDPGPAARRQRVGGELGDLLRLAQAPRPVGHGPSRLRRPWGPRERHPPPFPGCEAF
jgi:hypothetical protein